jgi:hypothetical protein
MVSSQFIFSRVDRKPHGQHTTWTYLTWVALPGAYAPATIALRVIREHELPLHGKTTVLEETDKSVRVEIVREYYYATLNTLLMGTIIILLLNSS